MFLSLAVAAVLSAAPSGKVAIIEISAPDMMLGLAGQVTRTLVSEAEKQKLDFVGPEVVLRTLPPKQYAELMKCSTSNVACVAQALEPLGYARAIVGRLDRDERNYLLKLSYFDLKQLTTIADVDRSILIAARRFQRDLEEAVPRLLRGEREARGTVIIESNVTDAQISLNGEFVGTPPVTLTLKPGKYEVKVERKKYLPVTRLVGVEANSKTTEKIQLLLMPGEVADATPVASAAAAKDAGAGVQLTAPTWIFGALTVASAGVGLYFGLTARGQEQKLLSGFKADSQVYVGTRSDALAATQNALLANVMYGVSGAALVATIIFAIRDGMSHPAVEVTPTVSASGAHVFVGGRF